MSLEVDERERFNSNPVGFGGQSEVRFPSYVSLVNKTLELFKRG